MTTISYITTAIPYVNARPHIGFALELVQADVLARHRRARGDRVRLQTGTDENSLKNVQAAERAGLSTTRLVADNAAAFAELADGLGISVDDTIRTSIDPRHQPGVERLWNTCAARGDIYKKAYRGLYCVGCEQFYRRADLSGGRCPEHLTVPEEIAEENYFFRLSHYGGELRSIIASGRLAIHPPSRRNEVLRWIERGLEDICISRSSSRAHGWGLKVPGDPDQIIYVWFDALANYVTALDYGDDGSPFRQFWTGSQERLHVIGKGISRFHAIYWPAMLLSAGLPLPTGLFVHGYVTLNGEKIAKSRGDAVDPPPLIERFGADGLRYFLLRHVSSTGDGDFSEARLRQAYDSELAGQLGNLVHRTRTMVDRYLGGARPIGDAADEASAVARAAARLPSLVAHHLERFAFDDALRSIWEAVSLGNRHINAMEPWKLAKAAVDAADSQDRELAQRQLVTCLADLIDLLLTIATSLAPFLPATSATMSRQLSGKVATRGARSDHRSQPRQILFPRLTGRP